MSTTFIAGYDGSDAARAALRFTGRLAAQLGGDVVAANVYPLVPAVLSKGASAGALHELRDQARSEAEKLLRESGVDARLVPVAAQSAAEGLHQLAEEEDAALVAVGGTHRGAIGKLVIGSVGEKLLHGSPSPVLTVPATTPDAPVESIAVAFDLREESRGALLAAKDLADRLGARLVVLSVHEPMYTAYTGYGAPFPNTDLERDLAREFEERVRREVAGVAGEDTEVRVRTGPVMTLLAEAGDEVDLIVTGSRGYGSVRGVLAGSVSRYLVDHARCPVLVLPRGAAQGVVGTSSTTATA
jgi:nucleotide-binding universal stress UspA family protein